MTYVRTCAGVLLLVCGCGSSAQSKAGASTTALDAEPGAVGRLEQQSRDQATRIAELEARLALLEQESRGFRESTPHKATETVRIGAGRTRIDEDEQELPRTTAVLRLHEEEPEPEEPLHLPAPPAGVSARLGVVPLPEDWGSASAKAAPVAAGDGSRERYRAALRMLQERRWDEARSALDSFVANHPGHELVDDALHWKGEAFYAERRYTEALAEFQAVLDRFPSSNKGPDALLKAGMCKKRQGASSEASRYFERLRNQYPDSEAARIASREGSS